MSLKRFDLNPIFVPYGLHLEDLETKGNYQPSELFGEIKGFNIPPYSLTIDKDKVKEMNLETHDNKLFYMEFNIENNNKKIKNGKVDI